MKIRNYTYICLVDHCMLSPNIEPGKSYNISIPKRRIFTIIFLLSGLEWRLDVKVASRMLRHQTTPEVMMKLSTTDEHGETCSKTLQTDPVNLLHMTQVLEGALKDVKSSHCRRIARTIK